MKKDLPVNKPGAGQLLLKVDAVGLCHSDLHVLYEGLDCGDNYVMGHEIAGTVAELGEEVSEFAVGDRLSAPMDVVFVNTVLLVTIMFVPSRFGLVWIGLQWRLRAILVSQETKKLGQDP